MSRLTDAVYLRREQYKTPANLRARASLHERFSTNANPWLPWVMDQLALQPGEHVLEVGGATGGLWRENLGRLPAGLRVCLTDFSLWMVRTAQSALAGTVGVAFANADVQALPLPAGAFDLVVADHMLYHVPDLPLAVRELARTLAPGGRLCATTNGSRHMLEYYTLLHQFDPRLPEPDRVVETFKYRLENAAAWLAPAFAGVVVRSRPDSLWVTDAGALADYALSSSLMTDQIGEERASELEAFFKDRIDSAGGLHITKDAGAVLARRA